MVCSFVNWFILLMKASGSVCILDLETAQVGINIAFGILLKIKITLLFTGLAGPSGFVQPSEIGGHHTYLFKKGINGVQKDLLL